MSLPSPADQQLGSGTLSDRHKVTSDEMRASSYSHLCSTASPQLPILYTIWSSLLRLSQSRRPGFKSSDHSDNQKFTRVVHQAGAGSEVIFGWLLSFSTAVDAREEVGKKSAVLLSNLKA